jgi:CRP-like cAMP-binding protein
MTDIRALHRFADLPLFAQLDERDLSTLLDSLVKRVQLVKGTLLYLQGEYSHTYYVHDRGTARLLRLESDGVERVIRELKPGQAVGENALLVGESRDVTLEVTGESTFFAIEQPAFEAFSVVRPEIAARLTPRQDVIRSRDAPRLPWQRSDEVLLEMSRASGWALTTRRLVRQDFLGRRQVVLRRVRDVRAHPAWLVGRWLDIGRVEVSVQSGKRLVWRGVRQPQRLANLIFTEVGRDQSRAHAEAKARAHRALSPQSAKLPPEPPRPLPDPLLNGENDWLAMGLWRLADKLVARLLPLLGEPSGPPPDDEQVAALLGESAPDPSRESPLSL